MVAIITRTLLCLLLVLLSCGCKRESRQYDSPHNSFESLTNTFKVQVMAISSFGQPSQAEFFIISQEKARFEICYGLNIAPLKGYLAAGASTNVTIPLTNGVITFTNGTFLDGSALVLGTNGAFVIRLYVGSQPADIAAKSRLRDLKEYHISLFGEKTDLSKYKKATPEQMNALVQSLRSENIGLNPSRVGSLSVPRNYSFEAQGKVFRAETALWSLGPKAIPSLMRHIADQSYSRTELFPGMDEDWSVHDVCFDIIRGMIQIEERPYGKTRSANGQTVIWEGSFGNLVSERYNQSAEAWWDANRYHSLKEMQIEALEWSIKREKNFGFSDPEEERQILGKLEAALQKAKAK